MWWRVSIAVLVMAAGLSLGVSEGSSRMNTVLYNYQEPDFDAFGQEGWAEWFSSAYDTSCSWGAECISAVWGTINWKGMDVCYTDYYGQPDNPMTCVSTYRPDCGGGYSPWGHITAGSNPAGCCTPLNFYKENCSGGPV